ncbi:hypothetical protein JKF63_07119 [Porcisia hertigi]|uniref:Condensin complex subunit 2 n=1 Tax=Porcisia hertigi TaxID=2761500 RepID=A0A836LKD7_9TRYP|nr:hypothetical protein JKF63_07119 [Porcisia hertigi]
MHTPELRPSHRGEAASVTPPIHSTTDNSAAPAPSPTPRAGFLRRGGGDDGALAAGPSVIFDEETNRAVAADSSPQPTQLTQEQALHPGRTRLPRQRPRFHTVQDLDVALNQAIEGKITSRNAWASKEASDLLEGITHTIETTLDAASADDYSGFTKAATVVEGCSKVWTSRVDSTYQQSNQMVQRLLRKGDASGKPSTVNGDDGEGEDSEGGGEQQQQRSKTRSRSAAAAALASATRTLAMEATEINLDSKSRTALTQTGVNAQFRAITSKFDQGNAQGLLMNNAPMGRAGNIILDVDYSVMPVSIAVSTRNQRGSQRVSGTNLPHSPPGSDAAEGQETQEETIAPSRVSQHAAVELDSAVYETVADLPPYQGLTAAVSPTGQLRSTRGSESFPQMRDSASGDARGSQASLIDPLLLLAHTAPMPQEVRGLARMSLEADAREGYSSSGVTLDDRGGHSHGISHSDWAAAAAAAAPAAGGGATVRTYDNQHGQEAHGRYTTHGIGGDDGPDGDDAGFDDWGSAGGDDDDANSGYYDKANLSVVTGSDGADRGAEARRLVSGAADMELIDTLFNGHTQLALEAEDPASWCPLSEVSANPLAAVQGLSELSRLHREHRFTQSQISAGGDESARNRNSGEQRDNPSSAVGAELPPPGAKRARKERTVVFQLPQSPASGRGAGASGVASTTPFHTEAKLLSDDGALRQAATAARNITPLGKQLLLAKDAAHAVLAYTQSAVQRSKADQAGLLLPEAPIPGKTIPSYMPFPVHTQDFFQPFSTSLTHWNLLRKSATGHLIDSIPGARTEGPSSASAIGEGASIGITGDGNSRSDRAQRSGDCYGVDAVDEDSYGGVGARYFDNMPVEFFPGGAEVEAQDGGEAGGDYADYAELYGPDDDHSDEEERRYVQGGFRNSADARLVEQMELATAASAAAASAAAIASGGSSVRTSGTGHDALLADPLELLKVLSPPEATILNQVDVVKLRELMWDALQGHLTANNQEETVDLAALRAGGAAVASRTEEEDEDGGTPPQVNRKGAALKAHALAALNTLRKRSRTGDGAGDAQAAKALKETAVNPLLGAGSTATGGVGGSTAQTPESVAPTRFSDVVRSVLPYISAVSSTNTLSPAFFFFSVLFLANEHNVVLQSVKDLDDLVVCGIAGRVGEA